MKRMMVWAVVALLIVGESGVETRASDSILTNVVDVSGFTKWVSFDLTQHDFERSFLFTAGEFTGQFTTSNLIAAIKMGGVEIRPVFLGTTEIDVIALNDVLARADLRSRFPNISLPKETEDLIDCPASPPAWNARN